MISRIKAPKPRKRRAASRAIDDDPFCTIIQKMMHAFGDHDSVSNYENAKKIQEYIKDKWVSKIKHAEYDHIDEVFIKRIYSKEIGAFKKLKNIIKDIDDFQNKEAEYSISFIPKEDIGEDLFNNDENMEEEKSVGSEKNALSDLEVDTKEVNDPLQEERTSFYSRLVDLMDEIQYENFSK